MVILIVEDEVALARIYVKILNTNGFDAVSVDNGREALAFIHMQAPDIVLCDIGLPDIIGFDVVPQLRQAGFKGPIIGMSGSSSDYRDDRLAVFDAVLDKPLRLTELVEKVRELAPSPPPPVPASPLPPVDKKED